MFATTLSYPTICAFRVPAYVQTHLLTLNSLPLAVIAVTVLFVLVFVHRTSCFRRWRRTRTGQHNPSARTTSTPPKSHRRIPSSLRDFKLGKTPRADSTTIFGSPTNEKQSSNSMSSIRSWTYYKDTDSTVPLDTEETRRTHESRHASLTAQAIFATDDPFACTLAPPSAHQQRDSHHSVDSQSTLVPLYTIDEAPPSYASYSSKSMSAPSSPTSSIPFPSSQPARSPRSSAYSTVEEAGRARAWWLSASSSASSSSMADKEDSDVVRRDERVQGSTVAQPEAAHVSSSWRTSASFGSWI